MIYFPVDKVFLDFDGGVLVDEVRLRDSIVAELVRNGHVFEKGSYPLVMNEGCANDGSCHATVNSGCRNRVRSE